MIKLLDILKEVDTSDKTHWRDHFREIIKCAEIALSSIDPETIAAQTSYIMDHAETAANKHEATHARQPIPTFINSNNSNSYSQNADDDINGYDGGSRI
jgi:hypothetical protein